MGTPSPQPLLRRARVLFLSDWISIWTVLKNQYIQFSTPNHHKGRCRMKSARLALRLSVLLILDFGCTSSLQLKLFPPFSRSLSSLPSLHQNLVLVTQLSPPLICRFTAVIGGDPPSVSLAFSVPAGQRIFEISISHLPPPACTPQLKPTAGRLFDSNVFLLFSAHPRIPTAIQSPPLSFSITPPHTTGVQCLLCRHTATAHQRRLYLIQRLFPLFPLTPSSSHSPHPPGGQGNKKHQQGPFSSRSDSPSY